MLNDSFYQASKGSIGYRTNSVGAILAYSLSYDIRSEAVGEGTFLVGKIIYKELVEWRKRIFKDKSFAENLKSEVTMQRTVLYD